MVGRPVGYVTMFPLSRRRVVVLICHTSVGIGNFTWLGYCSSIINSAVLLNNVIIEG